MAQTPFHVVRSFNANRGWFRAEINRLADHLADEYEGRDEITAGLFLADGGDTVDDDTTDIDYTVGAALIGGRLHDIAAGAARDFLRANLAGAVAPSVSGTGVLTPGILPQILETGAILTPALADTQFHNFQCILIDSDGAGGPDANGLPSFLLIGSPENSAAIPSALDVAAAIEATRGLAAADYTGNGGWAMVGDFQFFNNAGAFEIRNVRENRNNWRGL